MTERGLGYVPDPDDERDLSAEINLLDVLGSGEPPESCFVMLETAGEVLNQKNSESCVGFSGAGAIRDWWAANGKTADLPSALWLWTVARKTHGADKLNSGTYIRAMLKSAYNLGFCPEEVWPSDDPRGDCAKDPSEDQRVFRAAYDQKGFGYYRVTGFDDDRVLSVKRSIAAKCPVLFGTGVSQSFLDLDRHSDPVGPPKTSEIIGGHAMYLLAYDQFGTIGRNSWGEDWGNDGLFYLSWDYIVWLLTRDIWAVSQPPSFLE